MNKVHSVLRLAVLGLLALSLQAQGSLVVANYALGAGINAPVYDEDGVTRLAGDTFLAQLYLGTTASSLNPVAEALPFRTGAAAGYVDPTVVTLPGVRGGTRLYAQLRAWDATAGPTYEAALAAGGKTGKSTAFRVILAEAPQPPSDLTGLESFQLATVAPVTILDQPVSTLVAVGERVEFTVEAAGSPPLGYQWWKDGAPIPGAQDPVFLLPAASLADTGVYLAVVSNEWTSAETVPATLTVMAPPVIVASPMPQIIWPGGTAVFSAEVTGTGPLTYQWRFNGQNLPGATAPTLELANVTSQQAGLYSVVVANAVGSATSDPAELSLAFRLTILPATGGQLSWAPQMDLYPEATEVVLEPEAIDGFEFAGWLGDAEGTEVPLRIAMDRNHTIGAAFRAINGTVNFRNFNLAAGIDAPVYDEDGVTLLAGTDFAAQLYGGTSAETLAPAGPPVAFRTGPAAGYIEGELRAVPPVPLSGLAYVQMRAWETAAGDSYEAALAAGGKAGKSAVFTVVTGGGGSPPAFPADLVGLESFALTRGLPVEILVGPQSQTLPVGDTIVLEVTATGDEPLTYQWFKNEVPLAGAEAPSLVIPEATLADSGSYAVEVSSPYSGARSEAVEVLVLAPPLITGQPQGGTVLAGDDLELALLATGTDLSFQWFLNDEPIPGATESTFAVEGAAPVNAGTYAVEVANAVGSLRSEIAEVAVHFALTLMPSAGGWTQLDPALPSYPPEAVVVLTPRPYEGFIFSGWAGDASGLDVPLELIMDDHHELFASFWPVNGTVDFRNLSLAAGVDAPIYDEDETTLLEGATYRAQLYGGASPETLLPTGPSVPFRTGPGAGYIEGALRAVPPVAPGAMAYVQIRAWDSTAGESYEEAVAGGGKAGKSGIVAVITGGAGSPPTFPADLVGLESFRLTRGVPPWIVLDPVDTAVVLGMPATLTAAVDGTAPLAVQWFKDETPIDGETEVELTWSAVQLEDAGSYHLLVTNPWGTATSASATLDILVPPSITELALHPEVLYGADLVQTVTASGTSPLQYQWFAGESGDDSSPLGEDSPTLEVAGLTAAAPFWVHVSNAAGAVDSETIVPVILRLPQVIEFPPIAELTFGTPPVSLEATASSGLPVAFAVVTGPGEIVDQHLVVTGAGTITVAAMQGGNEQYLPADPALQNVVIAPAATSVLLSDLTQTYDGTPRVVGVVTDPPGLGVQITYAGQPDAPINAGSYAVRVVVLDDNYTGSAEETLKVAKAAQTISFDPLPDRTFGDEPFAVGATADSGLPVSVEVTSGPASFVEGLLTIEGAGEVGLQATQSGDENHEPAQAEAHFMVLKAAATIALTDLQQTYDGNPKSVVAQTAPPGLSLELTYDGASEPPVNAGQYAIHAEIIDANYAGSAEEILLVAKAVQTIGFDPLPDRTFGDEPFAVGATADSGLPVTVEVIAGPASFVEGLLTLEGAGEVGLQATQSGDENHEAAQAEARFIVLKAAASVNLTGLDHRYDGLPKSATVITVPEGLAVEIRYDGSAESPIEAGVYAVTATVVDSNYEGSAAADLVILPEIAGYAYEDFDGDGRRAATELGLARVTIRLLDAAGEGVIEETVTDESGLFTFAGLDFGTYVIEETDPTGFASTTPNRRSVILQELSRATVNFGDQRVRTVTGLVFNDLNANGLPDDGEAGLPDVVIQLVNALGTVVAETTTTETGGYAFANVAAGTYELRETDPSGYSSTTPNVRSISLLGGAAAANFGDRLAGVIGGTVFVDGNGDGLPSEGEPGKPGVRVQLDGPSGVLETLTDENGRYAFAQLPTGEYTVRQEAPEGFVHSTPSWRLVTLVQNAAGTADFGLQPLGTISGLVFDDANGSGGRDPGEPGLGGALIFLIDPEGTSYETMTDASGAYRFTPNLAGRHTVIEVDPAGFVSTTPNLWQVNVSGGSAAVANFGDQGVAQVVGAVFNDLNGNGRRDAGEQGIGGVRIRLIGEKDARFGLTSGDGTFVFGNVGVGTYEVQEIDPVGFTSTTPNNRLIVLTAGSSAAAQFGDQQVGSISGRVFADSNGNGISDPGEPGLAGVTLELANGADNWSTTTSGDGVFVFSGLTAGTYTIDETDPAGFASTTPNHRLVNLAPGGAATVNFGDQPKQTIVGSVFEDRNGNQLQDPGEPGIADVAVELLDAEDETLLASTTTAANGVFTFADLDPGNYIVRQVVPEGYTLAWSADPVARVALAGNGGGNTAEQGLTLAEDGAGSASFPTLVIGSITGTVFEDADGDEAFTMGEQGLAGVSVRLWEPSGTDPLLEIKTSGDGGFVFAGLPAGTYTVSQAAIGGYYSPNLERTLIIEASGAATVAFANYRQGTISGRVFHDENANRKADPTEPGLGQVVVQLTSASGTVSTTRTAGDGSFAFTRLVPGAYTLRQTVPEHFSNTTPNPVETTLSAGQSGAVAFGNVALVPQAPTLTLLPGASGPVIRVATETGRTYVLEASTHLKVWTQLASRRSTGASLDFTDSAAPETHRFYRVRVE